MTRIVNIRPTLLLLLSALLIAAPAAAKTYYKWTDDSGTVHFTSEPPNDRDYETVNTSGRVTGSSQMQSAVPPESTGDAEEVQMPRQGEPDPELVQARCRQARENLVWLQSNRRIVVENEDGGRTFIDDEEQQQLLEDNQALLDEWCRDDG